MASPPHSVVPSSVSGTNVSSTNPHDHHAALLMQQQQQQQQQVDYYQNPAAIYSQMQQQSHYGNNTGGSADLLATQQYLQNLQLGDPNMDGSGRKGTMSWSMETKDIQGVTLIVEEFEFILAHFNP